MSPTQYRILGLVGQGQFGRVLCARDRNTGSLVALKVLNKRELPTRFFLRELRLLASLQHPNIVSVQTITYTATERYLVMDYCEGGTLRDLLIHPVHLSFQQRLQLIIDVLKGLEYAHQNDIIHCDLKPENILLTHTENGTTARITDFGIARLAEEAGFGVLGQGDTGSPAYMAPERFYSQHSYASDLYAVGVMLYELLMNKRPFIGLPGELMTAHLNEAAQIPQDVPFLLRSVLKTALQKLPQKRFKSATDMLNAVVLAADILASEDPNCTLAPSQRWPENPDLLNIQQEQYPSPIHCLHIQDHQVYLGSHNKVICRSYSTDFPAPGPFQKQQWQFALPVTDLFWGGGQAWVRTIQGNTFKQPSRLHPLSLKNTVDSQPCDLPTIENLSGIDWGQNNKIGWRPEQNWLAIACGQQSFEAVQGAELGSQALLQIFQWPQMQPIHQPVLIRKPNWLFVLDSRFGVAISVDEDQSHFQGFTRRGNSFQPFSVPIPLQQMTQSVANPYRLLAVSKQDPQTAFLIDLKPWRLTKLSLALQPEQILATPWGYVLLATHQVLVLSHNGHPLSHFQLPIGANEKIAVCAGAGQGFMVGTWSEQSATLYTVDVHSHLTKWHRQTEDPFQETTRNKTA